MKRLSFYCKVIRNRLQALLSRELHIRVTAAVTHEYVGTAYGGWHVCLEGLDNTSIVYSGGVGEDISFDIGLHSRIGARVFAFDPTPRAIEWARGHSTPDQLCLLEVALGSTDSTLELWAPPNPEHVSYSVYPRTGAPPKPLRVSVRRIPTLMDELGHKHIDLLKLDIEGAEYDVIDDLLTHGVLPHQILVEFHHRFSGATRKDTRKRIKALQRHGYRVFAVSRDAQECCLIRLKDDTSRSIDTWPVSLSR